MKTCIEFTEDEVLELHNVVARATHTTGLLSECACTEDTMCVADRVITKVVDAYFEVVDEIDGVDHTNVF